MGYNTRYELTITGADCGRLSDIHAAMLQMDGPSGAFALEVEDEPSADYGDVGQPCKWYENEEDMRALSASFPGVLFTLRGKGQEAGDLWVKYFRSGKCQLAPARIEFDPFDEAKLA